MEQSRERSNTPLHLGVVAIEKGAFWSPSTIGANFTYLLTYHYYMIIYFFRVFHISISWWFFTGVWVTVSLLKSPELCSVFWPLLLSSYYMIIIYMIIILLYDYYLHNYYFLTAPRIFTNKQFEKKYNTHSNCHTGCKNLFVFKFYLKLSHHSLKSCYDLMEPEISVLQYMIK